MASPNFLQMLRLKNIFEPQLGNDLPSQGGFGGNMNPIPSMGPVPLGGAGFPEGFGPTPEPPPLFNPAPMDVMQPGTSLSQPMQMGGPSDRISQEMARLYTPETAATQNFQELLGQYPKQEDYKPSMLRRIGGALTAVGGSFDRGRFRFNPQSMEAGMNLLNEPYAKKINDWKNQIGPAYQGASLERQSNVNERTMAYQTISQQLRAEADDERAKNNERNAKIREDRARIYEFKARNPGMKFDFSGPTVLMADPASGKVSNTGVETGNMTDADKLTLQQEHAIERIEAGGAQARQTEGVRQEGRETLAWSDPYEIQMPDGTKKYMQTNKATGDIREAKFPGEVTRKAGASTGSGTKVELPTQNKVREYNNAREIVNTRPDLAKFVKLGPGTNEFKIIQPTENIWGETGKNIFGKTVGASPEQLDEIETAIYGYKKSRLEQAAKEAVGKPQRTGATPAGPQNTPEGTPNIRPPVSNSQNPSPKDTGVPYKPPTNMPQGNIMVKTQTNQRTGEKRTLRSIDGGKTWQVMNAPTATQ